MNPRILFGLFDGLVGASKVAMRREIDDAIQAGIFTTARNSNDLIAALRAGRLTGTEIGHFAKILMNNGDDALRNNIAKELIKSKSFKDLFAQNTEDTCRNKLLQAGWSNQTTESIIEAWKKEGGKFGTLSMRAIKGLNQIKQSTLYKLSPSVFKKHFIEGFRTKGQIKLYKDSFLMPFNFANDVFKLTNPFKRLTSKEGSRVIMWLILGVDKPTKDILKLLAKEGLIPLGGQVLGSGAKRWLIISAFLTSLNALYETYLEYQGRDEKENIDNYNFFTIFGNQLLDNLTPAEFKHVFPVGVFWNYIWPSINIPLSDLLSGRGLSNTLNRLRHELLRVDEGNVPETLKSQAKTLINDISSDGYGSYFLGDELLPIKPYQGMWVVQIEGQWYKISDIEKE